MRKAADALPPACISCCLPRLKETLRGLHGPLLGVAAGAGELPELPATLHIFGLLAADALLGKVRDLPGRHNALRIKVHDRCGSRVLSGRAIGGPIPLETSSSCPANGSAKLCSCGSPKTRPFDGSISGPSGAKPGRDAKRNGGLLLGGALLRQATHLLALLFCHDCLLSGCGPAFSRRTPPRQPRGQTRPSGTTA